MRKLLSQLQPTKKLLLSFLKHPTFLIFTSIISSIHFLQNTFPSFTQKSSSTTTSLPSAIYFAFITYNQLKFPHNNSETL